MYTVKKSSQGTLDQLSTLEEIQDTKGNPKQYRILVIEDSSIIQNMIRQILMFKQYEATFTPNGTEALMLCENNDYDLILMDLALPVLDGMACVKSIRAMKDPAKASVPVIAVTGNSQDYTPEEFRQAGFNAFHQKPIDFDELSRLISVYIGAPAT